MRRSLGLRNALLALLLLSTGGCYLAGERVIDNGEDAGIAPGTYLCRGSTTEAVTLSRRNETAARGTDVVYRVDRTDYRFVSMGNGLWLVQGTETTNFSYGYAERTDATHLRILYRDPAAVARAQELARKHGVQLTIDAKDAGGDKLAGSSAAIRAFLLAHDRSMLIETMSCATAG